MSLTPPVKLQKLQAALHAKAKASPKQRFHALYDKVYRSGVPAYAYDCCKANRGAAGGSTRAATLYSSRTFLILSLATRARNGASSMAAGS